METGTAPLCPNLAGSEEAPATANCGEEKKVRTAASIDATVRRFVTGAQVVKEAVELELLQDLMQVQHQ